MAPNTQAYCETCMTCCKSKLSNQKPFGLLNPPDIPGQPWESIGIDFVGPLPESKNHNGTSDSITVVICLLTGMVHLVPSCINYNAWQVAELVFKDIYKHHGLPKSIVSDHDILFTGVFWQNLHKLVGTKLKMSSAYHPETDGTTERELIGQLVRCCSSVLDWNRPIGYWNCLQSSLLSIVLDHPVPVLLHSFWILDACLSPWSGTWLPRMNILAWGTLLYSENWHSSWCTIAFSQCMSNKFGWQIGNSSMCLSQKVILCTCQWKIFHFQRAWLGSSSQSSMGP